jgi:hypothetical protein
MPRATRLKKLTKAPTRTHLVLIDDDLYNAIDKLRRASPTGMPTMPSAINALLRRGYEAARGSS